MILASQQQDHVERAVAGAAQSVECVQVLALTRAVSGVVAQQQAQAGASVVIGMGSRAAPPVVVAWQQVVVAQQPLLPVVVVVCVEAQHFALGAVVLAA
jgi:hypothetical protein